MSTVFEKAIDLFEGDAAAVRFTKKENILRLALAKLESTARAEPPKYWDGKAGSRIIQVLTSKPILT